MGFSDTIMNLFAIAILVLCGLCGVLAALLVAKLVQEWALHVARMFDAFTFVDALHAIWHFLTGG